VLPNVYPQPPAVSPRRDRGGSRLLFVGSCWSYPNRDAVDYFCREMLPRLRAVRQEWVELQVVGDGPPGWADPLRYLAGVRWEGRLDDLGPAYEEAALAVVPLRAGGGTRIKVLEAFCRGCPVVSTPLGIEGLAVRDGVHVELSDTPEGFAAACVRLLDDPVRRESLATEARRFYQAHHTPTVLAAPLRELLA